MKIVIDTNRIVAALIKESTSRKIIFSKQIEFLSPEYTITEINRYEKEICDKAHLSHDEFAVLLLIILQRIKIVPMAEYVTFVQEAKTMISDADDTPFLALAMGAKADGIWSDDAHFTEQSSIKIFKTFDMLRLL